MKIKLEAEVAPEDIEHLAKLQTALIKSLCEIWNNLDDNARQQILDSVSNAAPNLVATYMKHAPDALTKTLMSSPDVARAFFEAQRTIFGFPSFERQNPSPDSNTVEDVSMTPFSFPLFPWLNLGRST